MATALQLHDYLDEHLPYMLSMVRHTYRRIIEPKTDQMDLNAMFESFAVNVRNIVNLLTNKDKGNFKSYEFIPGYAAKKGDISGPTQLLETQVFHLGKSRPTAAEAKFNSSKVHDVYNWIESEMDAFLTELPPDLKVKWNASKAGSKVITTYHFDNLPSLSASCTVVATSTIIGLNGLKK